MTYTPGHDTARHLNRQVLCPICDGKGFWTAPHSGDSHNVTGDRRYECSDCNHGKINWRDYKAHYESQFGPARRA